MIGKFASSHKDASQRRPFSCKIHSFKPCRYRACCLIGCVLPLVESTSASCFSQVIIPSPPLDLCHETPGKLRLQRGRELDASLHGERQRQKKCYVPYSLSCGCYDLYFHVAKTFREQFISAFDTGTGNRPPSENKEEGRHPMQRARKTLQHHINVTVRFSAFKLISKVSRFQMPFADLRSSQRWDLLSNNHRCLF